MSTSNDEPNANTGLPRLELGQIVGTPRALKLLLERGVSPVSLLARHARGDWGDIPSEDAESNREALIAGFRVMSSYPLPGGGVVWFITEADRTVTTCLLPSEY